MQQHVYILETMLSEKAVKIIQCNFIFKAQTQAKLKSIIIFMKH